MSSHSRALVLTESNLTTLILDYGSSDPLFGLSGTADPIGIISTGIWWTVSLPSFPSL